MNRLAVLPLARTLPGIQRIILGGLYAVIGISLLAMAARALFGLGAGISEVVYTQSLLSAALVSACVALGWRVIAVPEQRHIWLPLTAGVAAYTLGTLLWAFWLGRLEEPPFPSLADPLRLAIYPLGFMSIVALLRERIGRIGVNLWLDGLVGALAAAAIAGALVLGPLTEGAEGSFAAVVTSLAYPLGDLFLIGVVFAAVLVSCWRVTGAFIVLAAGFVSFTAADVIYLRAVAAGDYATGLEANFLWLCGIALLSLASWRRVPILPGSSPMGRLAESVPTVLAVVAVCLLLLDEVARLDTVTVGLAGVALLVALARLARSAREERLLHESRREAHTDELTGLPNRRALNAAAAALLEPGSNRKAALLLIDLNDFKEINDTLGHEAGDQLLTALGLRLTAQLRPEDLLARLGGDEFAVLIDDCDDPSDAQATAWRLLSAMEKSFPVMGINLRVGASIGIACAPMHGSTPRELLRGADIAMYRAKVARSGVQVHDGSLDADSRERLAIVGELDRAFDAGEIISYFQPQIDLRTGQLAGVEALARWEHPALGTLGPGTFLAAVEQMNLSRHLTLRMIEEAAGLAAECAAAGLCVPVAVNLAAANLMDDALVGDLADILRVRALPSDWLRLEFTERIVMADPDRAIGLLHAIRAIGIGISLDDFGTDHSSLSYLNRLPVDELKIDRSLIADLATNPRTLAIVSSTLAMAHALELRSVAEGVEDRETLELLGEMGCDVAQGFYIARPMLAADLVSWAKGRRLANATLHPSV